MGRIDLDIEFVVTEMGVGTPVPGARVKIQQEGGLFEDATKQEFDLITDADGVARRECRKSMCFGTTSRLKFTDTLVVHLPFWMYAVTADGFRSKQWEDFDVLERRRQVERNGPERAKLVVPVELQRKSE